MHHIKKAFARNLRHETTQKDDKIWNALGKRKFFNDKFMRVANEAINKDIDNLLRK